MPIDSTPASRKSRHSPGEKPLTEPQATDEGSHAARDPEGAGNEGLVNHEMDEQTRIARPPLGN
ncbi:hypothetical protein [Polaromonas sp. CG9_12]|uniref:hypothetical protein n=1 Tax=Polaromonas sp. CG_9.11 TaxID=2787730 RepID=UPI0004DDD0CF|nr:hypothetical protein [Polaromonas sp. CG_9.11]MBG6074316.1 hypothetical protein [Polaromonas sp. CG_9.11]CDS54446.1 hypothetical protein [Polaromonas sp. CG9_12]